MGEHTQALKQLKMSPADTDAPGDGRVSYATATVLITAAIPLGIT